MAPTDDIQHTSPGRPVSRPVRVMLVDDADVVRRGLADLLHEIPGVEIIAEAEDSPQAIALLRQIRPDVLVLDFRMPGGDGLDVLQMLKDDPARPLTIVLTNYPEAEYRETCLAAGAAYFLDKSRQFDEVATIVRALVPGATAAAARPVRILVTDDSVTMRRMVMASLQALPCVSFDQAASGLEAIERLALAPVDLMVLDLNMPDMHGFDVLRFLRSHAAYRDLSVLVLTTRDDDDSRAGALACGASAYLTKPFQPAALVEQVRALLADKPGGGEL